MNIAIHDSELSHFRKIKTFPNLAIMKLSAYHKNKGNNVEWWSPDREFDIVYSSKVFTFSKQETELPANTITGGTGYDIQSQLPPEIDDCFPDYSMYGTCDYAVGFVTRGCPNGCAWCVVPQKEGDIRPYRDWQDIVRKDSNQIVLLDNNILASSHGIRQLELLTQTDYKVDINQGMDIRLVNDEICSILKQLKWIKFIRFSCDTIDQLPYFQKLNDLFQKHGIPKGKIFIYLIVRDDLSDAEYRVKSLCHINKAWAIYAQAEHPINGSEPNWWAKQFARYVYSRAYKNGNWKKFVELYLLKNKNSQSKIITKKSFPSPK